MGTEKDKVMSVGTEKKPKIRETELKKLKEEVDEVMNKRMGDSEKYDIDDVIRIDEINEEIGEMYRILELKKNIKNLYKRKGERLMNKLNDERDIEKRRNLGELK